MINLDKSYEGIYGKLTENTDYDSS